MIVLSLSLAAAASIAEPGAVASGIWLIPGHFEPGRGPDGNSVLIDAPGGLILLDSGRHAAHQQAILAAARRRGRPIVAIVNTHWHLDHSGGNAEIRAAFPKAPLYASNAIDGALSGFLANSRKSAEARLAAGAVSPEQAKDARDDFAAIDAPEHLRPDRPVTRSGPVTIAGRALQVNLAPFAATEGDIWLYEPGTRTAIVGDLVVDLVPFMDTACPEGWRRALDRIAAVAFTTLVPGHGATMGKPRFLEWRTAYGNLLDCGAGNAPKSACVAGWLRDARAFIPASERARAEAMVGYYLDTRLRAGAGERDRYCRPMG